MFPVHLTYPQRKFRNANCDWMLHNIYRQYGTVYYHKRRVRRSPALSVQFDTVSLVSAYPRHHHLFGSQFHQSKQRIEHSQTAEVPASGSTLLPTALLRYCTAAALLCCCCCSSALLLLCSADMTCCRSSRGRCYQNSTSWVGDDSCCGAALIKIRQTPETDDYPVGLLVGTSLPCGNAF